MSRPTAAALPILLALAFAHAVNDALQALLSALYPVLKASYGLTFGQIGLITLVFQCTASLLQPGIGHFADRRPFPASLPLGMAATLAGILFLAWAGSYPLLLAAAALIGIGSAVFHPEASRVARLASGGRHGMAQSLFQVGGNVGTSLGPLLAVGAVGAGGQSRVAWFSLLALLGIVVLARVGGWYRAHLTELQSRPAPAVPVSGLPRRTVARAVAVLLVLIFSKYFYLACVTSYFTFYLIEKFGLTVRSAQLHLFLFLAAVAAGTFLGGPVGDRIGRKRVIWLSILGAAPFALLLPWADLFWTGVLAAAAGFVLSSAFAAIVVYAQDLLPGRVGTVSGLFFGFAFGMGGIGSAALGALADRIGIAAVFGLCAYLPLLGLLTAFLPEARPAPVRPSGR